ncbi:oligoendopeptidase F [bacterium]|nr:oligoendopeptidase F [bacterium]
MTSTAEKSKVKKLPPRSKVKADDTWDLSSLYPTDAAWEKDLVKFEGMIPKITPFKGTLADSPAAMAKYLTFDEGMEKLGERLGTYVFLRTSEDTADGKSQEMYLRYSNIMSKAGQEGAFARPEIMAIPAAKMKKFLAAKELSAYRLLLERLIRYKPHTLSASEERLIAMQSEMSEASNQIFGKLNDADLKFGEIQIAPGETIELSHSSFSRCLENPDRKIRKQAFHQYYAEFSDHANTLASTLNASVQRDVYYARARSYPSALESSLFGDNVPISVYTNLIDTVHRYLPSVHRYVDVRRRALKLKDVHMYDTYVPIVSEIKMKHTWAQASKVILKSLEPLGSEYCGVLEKGLLGRWCDKYENKGKRSGAFSCGSFFGDPYILMNYQPDVLNHVFTLAHEAGHSMHSYYSAKHQPFVYYNYTIFVAEVASTFNEELLGKHLMEHARDDKERAYFITRELDDIRATLVRQTMFAEFEKIIHDVVENGEALTLERIKGEYRKLLDLYFGKGFVVDPELELESLRIPHFYRAFYVYKYATGISAAIALSQRVLSGGKKELDQYLGFLKAGCSKFPLDILRDAGVDMEKPEPVAAALKRFDELVTELDELV